MTIDWTYLVIHNQEMLFPPHSWSLSGPLGKFPRLLLLADDTPSIVSRWVLLSDPGVSGCPWTCCHPRVSTTPHPTCWLLMCHTPALFVYYLCSGICLPHQLIILPRLLDICSLVGERIVEAQPTFLLCSSLTFAQ